MSDQEPDGASQESKDDCKNEKSDGFPNVDENKLHHDLILRVVTIEHALKDVVDFGGV